MKILIDEEVVKQALVPVYGQAHPTAGDSYKEGWRDALDYAEQAIDTALRSALQAEKVEPIPVAYFQITGEHQGYKYYEQVSRKFRNDADVIPLFAAPTPPTNTGELREAARAIVNFWPEMITFEAIDRLRKAL